MKIFIMLMLAAMPAAAEWGKAEGAAAARLNAARAEVQIISGAPLLELLAARDKASLPLTIGGRAFLATVVFDSDWDTWFSLKPAGDPLAANAWKEADLAAGAVYKYKDLAINLKETGGVVAVESSAGDKQQVAVNALFDLLYAKPQKITFGEAVTYAAFRNIEPLTQAEGTVMLRVDQNDGLYYYSVTPDAKIASEPHWLLAVNGVLYGLRVDSGSLLFVSKVIELNKPAPGLRGERRRAR